MEETCVRHLARVAAAAAAGRRDLLPGWYREALDASVSPADLQEATLQVFLFAGFPRALGAFGALAAALGRSAPPPPVEAEPADLVARGAETFRRVYGRHAGEVAARLRALHPEFARFVLHTAYGGVLGRPFLPLAVREVLAVAMLAVLELRDELRAHVRGALRVGVAPDSVRLALAAAEEAAGETFPAAREIVARALAAPPPQQAG